MGALSGEELEKLRLIRRRAARAEYFHRLAREDGGEDLSLKKAPPLQAKAEARPARFRPTQLRPVQGRLLKGKQAWQRHWPRVRENLLLALEVSALIALIVILALSLTELRFLNRERAQGGAEPTPTSLSEVKLLPGSRPPGMVGGVPAPLKDLAQPVTPLPIPTPGPRSPTRIVIPAIGVDAPVVEGDGWEELKKGVGHHIGSANPGERGNMVLSGHNDIFGEVFRDLDKLQPGDEIVVYAGDEPHRYRVKAKRIVEPTDVSVMEPTTEPVLTLITCYPYLIDTHRLVVIAELER